MFLPINKNEEDYKKDLSYKIRSLIDHAKSIFPKYNVPGKCLNID